MLNRRCVTHLPRPKPGSCTDRDFTNFDSQTKFIADVEARPQDNGKLSPGKSKTKEHEFRSFSQYSPLQPLYNTKLWKFYASAAYSNTKLHISNQSTGPI